MPQRAVNSYSASSANVKALLQLESAYSDPPSHADLALVEGLRGGSVVLMVAAFENYVKESVTEALESINTAQPPCVYSRLPPILQTEAVWSGLELAMKGRPGSAKADRSGRLPEVLVAIDRIRKRELIADAVARTAGNPDSACLKAIFKTLNYRTPFRNIKSSFDAEWGQPTATTFIEDTLDIIVARRHVVAHTASILNTSRADLNRWHRFLEILVQVLDVALDRHLARIVVSAQ